MIWTETMACMCPNCTVHPIRVHKLDFLFDSKTKLSLSSSPSCHFCLLVFADSSPNWNSSKRISVLTQFRRFSANFRCWLTCLYDWTSRKRHKHCRSTWSRVSLHKKMGMVAQTFWSHLVSCHLLRKFVKMWQEANLLQQEKLTYRYQWKSGEVWY